MMQITKNRPRMARETGHVWSRTKRHWKGTGKTRAPRGGRRQPLRSSETFGFFFHVFFHGNMGEGAVIVTPMTANAPLFNPSFLNKSLIALGTDKDPFHVMHLSLKLHPLPPSGQLSVRIDQRIKPAIGDFAFATGKACGVSPPYDEVLRGLFRSF